MPDLRAGQPLQSDPNRPSTIVDLAAGPDLPDAEGGLRVTVRPDGDIDVVVLAGELDIATAPELMSVIDGELIQGRNRIVLDLDAVTFFDARAIDAIISATCAAALAGGRLFVTHNPRFMLLLTLTCEVHRVNVTEAMRTGGPEPRDVRDGDLAALVTRSAEGDESAFAAVYDATAARAYGLGERLLGDPALASDAVREAYLHLWAQSARYQPEQGSAISWILGIVHRCSVARIPPRDLRMLPDDLNGETLKSAPSALGLLHPVQRRAVELAYFAGYTHTEVAQMLDLPIGDGQTQIGDALLALDDLRKAVQTPGMEGAPP